VVISKPRRDPEKVERSFLQRYTAHPVGRVLDIGCGDGRLTWEYARHADLVVGIDLEMEDLLSAKLARPEADSAKVYFAAATGEAMPFVNELFNLALFSWSL
jgi:ubiquinone/menaquinone biosynthesis C-methylase UbiE